MKNILSLDGGGIRTYIPLRILNEIEIRTGKHPSEIFDYFTGVSAGSLIANLLLLKNEDGKPKYDTFQILNIFIESSSKIFYYTYYDLLSSGFGVFKPLYSLNNVIKTITERFEKNKFRDLLKPSCVITYDMLNSEACYFNTLENSDMDIADAIIASASAPTYFEPYKIILNDKQRIFIDGGMVTNNPVEICFLKACEQYPDNNFYVLSLGTGYINNNGFSNYGLYDWSKNILNVLFSANASFQSNELLFIDKLLPNNLFDRINVEMPEYISLDDLKSFSTLKIIMDNWINNHNNEIDSICDKLKRNIPSSK